MYTCRLVLLFHSREYNEFQDSAVIRSQELDLKLVCQPQNHNVLTVSGFCTEDQAIKYLEELKTAFHWLMLDEGSIVDASLDRESIQRHCTRRHGCNFSSKSGQASTHIYEIEYGYIHTTHTGSSSVLGASMVFHGIKRGLDIAARLIPEIDKDLSLSLDLYRSSILQVSLRARFAILITSMECQITSVESRDNWQIALLDKFIAEIAEHDLHKALRC